MARKKRSKTITVTVKRALWQVKLERGAKNARRVIGNALAVVGFVTVIVLIARG